MSSHFYSPPFAVHLILLSLLSLHCEHAGPFELDPLPEAPGLSELQATIFDDTCALSGCHVGPNAIMGIDLSEGQAYASLVNVRSTEAPNLFLVHPGKPDSSYLIAKLEGNNMLVPGTFRMPLGREPLTEVAIAAVREWIARGAIHE